MPLAQITTERSETGEIAILGRVLSNGKRLTPALARHLLELEFSEADTARINDLASRNQIGALSAAERADLRDYANAGCLLGILHAKARRAIRKTAKK
jgi:hypothetical protein